MAVAGSVRDEVAMNVWVAVARFVWLAVARFVWVTFANVCDNDVECGTTLGRGSL